MPLPPKGSKIMRAMQREYGAKKGKSVFYASKNAGKIKGVEGVSAKRRANNNAKGRYGLKNRVTDSDPMAKDGSSRYP